MMNSDLLIFLGALLTFVGTIITFFIMLWQQIKEVKAEIKVIHISINSRMDELLNITRTTAHAAGVNEEKFRATD